MKKKKYLTGLMEENLMETIQQRIDELKLLIDEQHCMTTQSWDLRCKLRRELKHEQAPLFFSGFRKKGTTGSFPRFFGSVY